MNNHFNESTLKIAKKLRVLRATRPQPGIQKVLSMEPYRYYADLLDYTKNVLKLENGELNPKGLEERFFQPFEDDLLLWERAENDEIHQVRLCVESLRWYLSDLKYKPDVNSQKELDEEKNRYLQNVHRALLEQIGTSYDELRDVVNAPPQVREELAKELANRLGFDLIDSKDPVRLKQLLLSDITDRSEIEQKLEELFGLRDTQRIGYSNGAIKLTPKASIDSISNLRWFFEGVRWNINTDQDGCVYLSSILNTPVMQEIKVFRDSSKQELVASGNLEAGKVILTAQKTSDLSGALFGVDVAKIQNTTIIGLTH